MNWYKRYIGDYQRDTAHLSMVEHGAYTLLLDAHYGTGRPLPSDPDSLFRITRALTTVERDATLSVIRQYWVETDSGWINARASKEIAKAMSQAETNRRIAKERKPRQKPRYNEPLNEPLNEPPNESFHEVATSQIPDPRSQKKKKPDPRSHARARGLTKAQRPQFAAFWKVWPLKSKKREAERAWMQIDPDPELAARITLSVTVQVLAITKHGEDPKARTPDVTTWLSTWLEDSLQKTKDFH